MKKVSVVRVVVATALVEMTMIALAFLWVALYSYLIHPGETAAFYQAYARVASPAVSLVAGPIVFGALGFILAGRWGDAGTREAWWIVGVYLVLDIVIVLLLAEDLRYNLLMWVPNAVTKIIGVWVGLRFVPDRR